MTRENMRLEALMIASILRETDKPEQWTVDYVEDRLNAIRRETRRHALHQAAERWEHEQRAHIGQFIRVIFGLRNAHVGRWLRHEVNSEEDPNRISS